MAPTVRPLPAGAPALLEEHLDVAVNGPTLVFDWASWQRMTAIAIMVVNKGGGAVTATPEASPDAATVCTQGIGIPVALTIPAGEASYDPYGIDQLLPYWRLWLDGTTTCDVYVYVVPRGTIH